MAKMVRLIVRVTAAKVADALDVLADVADSIKVENASTATPDDADDSTDDADDVVERKVRTANAGGSTRKRSTRLPGRVIYTPAGTQKQITRLLDSLRGQNTMRAFVLRDLVKHPGSTNRDVRSRIEPAAKKAGLSIESVDNVIWQMVNKGQIEKQSDVSAD